MGGAKTLLAGIHERELAVHDMHKGSLYYPKLTGTK